MGKRIIKMMWTNAPAVLHPFVCLLLTCAFLLFPTDKQERVPRPSLYSYNSLRPTREDTPCVNLSPRLC